MPDHTKPNPAVSRRALLSSSLAAALAWTTGLGCQRRDTRDGAAKSGAPARVASRTVFADEVLWAMGAAIQARVIGLSPMADDPRYSTVAGRWPKATPRLGLDPEALLALAPDLVILASFSAPEYIAAIEAMTTVLVLDDFSGFAGYLDNVRRIGAALAEPEAAAALVERFEARRAALEAERPPDGARPTVLAWDYGHVPGSATSFDDVAACAGFLNVPARAGIVGHQRLDAEQLVAWDPDWIVVGCGDTCHDAAAKLAEQPGFSALRAVRDQQVIAVEAPYLNTVGEGMLELAARMQAALRLRSHG